MTNLQTRHLRSSDGNGIVLYNSVSHRDGDRGERGLDGGFSDSDRAGRSFGEHGNVRDSHGRSYRVVLSGDFHRWDDDS